MTKAIPDPPHRSTTASAAFGSCEHSHPPLFSVCAGVELEDALVHLSSLLKGACASNLKALQITDGTAMTCCWAMTIHWRPARHWWRRCWMGWRDSR